MDVRFVSTAQPGALENQDFCVATADCVVAIDGATPESHGTTGCQHGVEWYIRRLGTTLVALLVADAGAVRSLANLLEEAIIDTSDQHRATCDLQNPQSPSATVGVVRTRGCHVEYLVLGDCAVVLSTHDDVLEVVVDDRLQRLNPPDRQARNRLRNQPHGFWVASSRPEAAHQALTGTRPRSLLKDGAVLTDGATRLVDIFGWSWQALVDLLRQHGPSAVVREVRSIESAAGPVVGAKQHDDVTVVFCHLATRDGHA